PPTSTARASSPSQRSRVGRMSSWNVMASLDAEREVSFGAVPVARDDAPEHPIATRWQRRQTDLEERAVRWVDARVTLVDAALVSVLDTHRAEHGLDPPVEPDTDRRRRGLDRVPDPRLRMVGKRMSPREARHEQQRHRCRQSSHAPRYCGWVGPRTP